MLTSKILTFWVYKLDFNHCVGYNNVNIFCSVHFCDSVGLYRIRFFTVYANSILISGLAVILKHFLGKLFKPMYYNRNQTCDLMLCKQWLYPQTGSFWRLFLCLTVRCLAWIYFYNLLIAKVWLSYLNSLFSTRSQ